MQLDLEEVIIDTVAKSPVSCYRAKLTNSLDVPPKCPMQFCFGDTNMMTDPDVINRLGNSISVAEIHIYLAGHSFANDAMDAYVTDAAMRALGRSVSFLNTHRR